MLHASLFGFGGHCFLCTASLLLQVYHVESHLLLYTHTLSHTTLALRGVHVLQPGWDLRQGNEKGTQALQFPQQQRGFHQAGRTTFTEVDQQMSSNGGDLG